MFRFLKPSNNPNNLTGTVGGTATSVDLSGYLGELFVHVDAPPYDTEFSNYQYRKIFIKNEYENTSNNTRLWLDAEQHRGQISVALQISNYDYIDNATIEPSGISDWYNPTNYIDGMDVGTLAENASTGIWIRQKLNNIRVSDPYASLRLYVGGLIE